MKHEMDNLPSANPSRSPLLRLWPWLLVLAVLLFVGFIRVRLLDMPLERDEGEYAYAGQLILQGIPPYELAYNMKLPGTYYAYAAGMAVFGQTTSGIHLTLLLINALTTVFVFLLGRKLFGTTAGLVACASYGLMSVSTAVVGMAAHATQFVVLFAVPGALVLWKAVESRCVRTIFFSGLLFGLALLMKQQGICFGLFGLAFLFWEAFRRKAIFTRVFASETTAYAAGFILPFAFFFVACAIAGDFSRFWFWTFDYARAYASGSSFGDGMVRLNEYIHEQILFFAGFAILTGSGLVVALCRPWKDDDASLKNSFAMGFLFFSFLGTTPGLFFRAHYFVVFLPAFAVATGMAVAAMESGLSKKMKIIPALLFAGVMAWSVKVQAWAFFRLPPPALLRAIYGDNPFVESVMAAQYIRENSNPGARVAVIGSEPEIYFYADRHSATGYIYTYPLMEPQPYAIGMQREMIGEIEAAKPEFIVLVLYKYSWLMGDKSDPAIINWAVDYAKKFYEPAEVIGLQPDGRIIWVVGKAAKDFHNSLPQFMVIYQRKPA
jgi:4-amino-4-deoxy-L-arabinose transferase-like glycosyltransferase